MDDVISLSSGNEEDSDVEFVGSYSNDRDEAVPYITAELLPVTPVLIDITGHHFSSVMHQWTPKTRQSSTIEVIDLNLDDVLSDSSNSDAQLQNQTKRSAEHHHMESSISTVNKSCGQVHLSSCTQNFEKDEIYLDSGNGHGQLDSPAPEHSSTFDIYDELSVSSKNSHTHKLQNTKHTEPMLSISVDHSTNLHTQYDEKLDSPLSFDKSPSPFSLDSPYYCPSEVDDVFFSLESNRESSNYHVHTTTSISNTYCTESLANIVAETKDIEHPHKSQNPQTKLQLSQKTLLSSPRVSPTYSPPCSPTSTEILAGESPDTVASLPDSAIGSPPSPSQHSPRSPLSSSVENISLDSKNMTECPPSQWISFGRDKMDTQSNFGSSSSDTNSQAISLVQLKKLKHFIGGVWDVCQDGKDEDDYGPAEPLCRQSLSLVYSTIEENYPEGTLQLLSDLIQPRYYPPVDITSHLLRGILLEPQCTDVLVLEAYNLLMRTQKYHPADISNVPWDWELLSSVMSEQDDASGLRSEVRYLLFQYVLQVLEDDFRFKLPVLQRHLSIARATLSCHHRFRQVKELICWLLDAAKQYCNYEDDKKVQRREKTCIKMLLILQRMLLLAMEVDRMPTCSSNKLSLELWTSLNNTAPCRKLRMLLLSTLESNLLRCKLLELLLDQACTQKRPLPMSFKLLLHFLQTSTLAPDPSDDTERWKRWDELLQLVWMLMLSYEEVMTGHLRCSITERFTLSRAPMWTQNDQVTRTAVQEAVEAFLSRAVEDLGHALPAQIQESLFQLQEHLLSINLQ